MCDTIYAGPAAAGPGRAWFAKNSDRHPSEPQPLVLVPRREASPSVTVGKRVFPAPDRGLAFLLSKPSWMEGGEAGLNEAGVAIGNEAVFSRWKPARDGFLGMELLRGALAASGSAKEAIDFIAAQVEAGDQGGNGAFRGSLRYDNSYIVAGPDGAFVLETAGRRWAWKAVEGVAAISNAYSIEEDFKRLDTRTRKEISPVNERAACSDEADPGRHGRKESWRHHVENRFYLRFTRADRRRAATSAILEAARPDIGLEEVLGALRSHGGFAPGKGGMASPCLHGAGFPLRSATTASFAVEYLAEPGSAIAWFTGAPFPCLSVFAPVLLSAGSFVPLWTGYDLRPDSGAGVARWERRRASAIRAGGAGLAADPTFLARRDLTQSRLAQAASAAARAPGEPRSLAAARAEVDATMEEWESFLDAGGR